MLYRACLKTCRTSNLHTADLPEEIQRDLDRLFPRYRSADRHCAWCEEWIVESSSPVRWFQPDDDVAEVDNVPPLAVGNDDVPDSFQCESCREWICFRCRRWHRQAFLHTPFRCDACDRCTGELNSCCTCPAKATKA